VVKLNGICFCFQRRKAVHGAWFCPPQRNPTPLIRLRFPQFLTKKPFFDIRFFLFKKRKCIPVAYCLPHITDSQIYTPPEFFLCVFFRTQSESITYVLSLWMTIFRIHGLMSFFAHADLVGISSSLSTSLYFTCIPGRYIIFLEHGLARLPLRWTRQPLVYLCEFSELFPALHEGL